MVSLVGTGLRSLYFLNLLSSFQAVGVLSESMEAAEIAKVSNPPPSSSAYSLSCLYTMGSQPCSLLLYPHRLVTEFSGHLTVTWMSSKNKVSPVPSLSFLLPLSS